MQAAINCVEHLLDRYGNLAGTDTARADDINNMFADNWKTDHEKTNSDNCAEPGTDSCICGLCDQG